MGHSAAERGPGPQRNREPSDRGAVLARLEPLTEYEIVLVHRDAPLTPAARALVATAIELFPQVTPLGRQAG